MTSIDKYVRKQTLLDNLKFSLKDLYNQKVIILNELLKVEKQIEKHEDFIKKLEEDEDG